MNTTRSIRITVRGRLSTRFAAAFDELTLAPRTGATELVGEIADQAQLHGLLSRIRDLGLDLVSVTVAGPKQAGEDGRHDMGGESIEAAELAGLTNRTREDTPRRRCLVAGCGCMDQRILSSRRARFHAYLARARGETADRVIAPDLDWRLPPLTNQEA